MIYCILDGDRVYPSLSSNIKITRENPELKDKGSYTLDVTFPMDIYENLLKFRHLNRIEVSLKKNDYKSATLYVGHQAVISGIGVVTSVSNKEVKLQIMNANSEFKYASGFDKKYIDDIARPFTDGIFTLFGKYLPGYPPRLEASNFFELFAPTMIDYEEATKSQRHVGDASIGIYTPIYDETNDKIVNEIAIAHGKEKLVMINPECQFNLLYVMKALLGLMGYVAELSVIDKYPWNSIYIVNTGWALPHWTLERFITEFKSLFALNVKFEGRNAIFGRIDYDAEAVTYECLDEFSSEYDDEGIQSNSTSNLRYNLYDSAYKTSCTEIPDEVMNAFTVREYTTDSEMQNTFNTLTDTEKAQSIFSTPTGYFYAKATEVSVTGAKYTLVRAGHFNKLVRDPDNDDAQELNIVPVTMATFMDMKFRQVSANSNGLVPDGTLRTEKEETVQITLPTAESEEAPSSTNFSTVQQALEEGDSVNNSQRSESERMEVFFLDKDDWTLYALGRTVRIARIGTDHLLNILSQHISFALDKTVSGTTYIGQFHTASNRINGKNQRCIKFITDDIPDPTRIYIFHNKRYVCEKIEIQVTEHGIDKVKTGYFYEILG